MKTASALRQPGPGTRHAGASRRPRVLAALLLVVVAGAVPSPGAAELLVKGTGPKRVLVKEQFAVGQQARHDLFVAKCTRCHAMGRIIDSLDWGYTPMTGSDFDEPAIRRYVIKMMRKSKSGISKRDARELTEFLLAAAKLAGAAAPAPTAPPGGATPPTERPPAPAPAPAPAEPRP